MIAKIAVVAAAAVAATTLMVAGPAAAATNDCSHGGGTWGGSTYGTLSNGELHVGECNNAFDGSKWIVRQVNVEYSKYSGGAVSVQFGWQMVSNSSASSVYHTWWSSTTYSIAANQTKGTYFAYPGSSPAAFSSSWKCLRGVMKDTNTELVYVTKTICKL
jgi:hypothetical protein